MGDLALLAAEEDFRGTARFEVVGRLGSGGMGIVYEARDRERGVRVALKGLRKRAADNILRFKAEFRALRDLEHPNLLRLDELFEENGRWFFTMELIEGADFLRYVRSTGAGAMPSEAPNDLSVARVREVLDHATTHRDDGATQVEPRGAYASISESGERPTEAASVAEPLACDDARLRGALAQLVLGLDALHRAGMVHRDVKPSNVLVEGAGRVVLLDFGVVAELEREAVDQEGWIVGTAAYMSPEQGCGEPVGPPADWYALGVILYQALTGRLPFDGSMMQILARKAAGDLPPPPTLFAPGAPADLAALCMRLLALDPDARPPAEEILRALGTSDPAAMLALSRQRAAHFVGREAEVGSLVAAYARSREGGAVQVFVEGVSGIGKSAAVARAIDEIRASHTRPIVLRGRCHENETVPYNAFDGVVDDLSRELRNLPDPSAIALRQAGALLRLFPALESVEALAAIAMKETPADVSPIELRQLAFDRLRELVATLALSRPVVLVLEDVHWADAEALALLREWGRAPPPGTLVVGTARPSPEGASCPAIAQAQGDVEVMRLGALSESDARALVAELVANDAARGVDVEGILAEAAGHPMFLAELHAFSREHASPAHGAVRLDDALLARVGRMPPLAQRALEVVATAGVPIREAALGRVLDAPRAELAPQISVLRSARLLRAAGTRLGSGVEPFHDRVREAVYRRMGEDRRASLHRRLGLLLEKEGAPHEILLTHFERCGDKERAVAHALAGAELAAKGLAFERAASLYRYAVTSGLKDPDGERALRTAMGEMLQRAGRPKDAAEAFAAAALTGSSDPDAVFDLRRRSAEQYLTGGYRDEGIAASRAVLAHVGESRPRWYLAIVVLALWHMLLLRLARLAYEGRDADAVPPPMRRRLDAYWSLTAGLVFLDSIRGGTFSSKGALLAVRHGDDLRVARATCAASLGVSGLGDGTLARRLIDVTRRAAERAGTDVAHFYVDLSEVGYTFMIENDCRLTLDRCERARNRWARIGHRGGWESDLVEQYQLWALAAIGDVRRLVEGVAEGVRFARATGNRFREYMFRASFPQENILRDAPEEGEADVLDAVREWAHADGRFATPDYWALKSRCMLASYSDRDDLMAELEREWRRYDASALNQLAILAMESSDLRANLALRRAVHAKMRGDARATAGHLRRARRFMDRLERSPLRFGRLVRLRLLAVDALLVGDARAARRLLEGAIVSYEAEGWIAQVAGLRHLLGKLIGGDEGAVLVRSARAWVAQWKPKNSERLLALLVPGAPLLAGA